MVMPKNPIISPSAKCLKAKFGRGGGKSIRTSSNLHHVMPTISMSEYKGRQNQKDFGGGYVLERWLYK